MTLQEIQAKSTEVAAAAGEVIDRENAIEAVLTELGAAMDTAMVRIQEIRSNVKPSLLKK